MTLTSQVAKIDDVINKSITRQCDPPQIKCAHHGRVSAIYSQQEKRFMLIDSNLKKVTIESTTFDFQGAHILDSGSPITKTQYGEFESNTYRLNLVYMGVSRVQTDYVKVLQCMEKIPMLGIVSFVTNSEQVIRDDWRTLVGDERNYIPTLFGFRINYTLQINHLDELI